MTRQAAYQPLVSGLILLDHAPGTSGELEVDWSAAPWAIPVPAALPKRRPKPRARTGAKRRPNAKARRAARVIASSPKKGLWGSLSARLSRTAHSAGLDDLPKRLSSRFAPAWTGALAAAGITLCPACRSRNSHRATFCHECHVGLREIKSTFRPAPRQGLEIHVKVTLALTASLLFTVFLAGLTL